MNYLEDEKYLLDLLTRNKLLNAEQVKTFILKKEQQRHLLVRKIGGRRADDRKRSSLSQPDVFDILVSLQFAIPGKKKQVLSEEDIIRAVAEDLNLPFKKLDPLDLDLDLVPRPFPSRLP